MSENINAKHISEIIGSQKYLLEVVKAQLDSDHIKRYEGTNPLLRSIQQTLESHLHQLDRWLDQIDESKTSSQVRQNLSGTAGKIAAFFESMRSETASRMLRDTYAALSLVTISYTILHAGALATHDGRTAELALEHLNDLTPLVVELSKVIPRVVVNETADDDQRADRSVANRAMEQTHQAWSNIADPTPLDASS